jgi:hypothetical protein
MADGGGGNAMLGVIAGALLVIVIGFFVFGGIPGHRGGAERIFGDIDGYARKKLILSLRAARQTRRPQACLIKKRNGQQCGPGC